METRLETPLLEQDVSKLRVGDVVYISGTIFTARDRAHQRIIEQGAPFDLNGSVIFHAGPIIKLKADILKDVDLDKIHSFKNFIQSSKEPLAEMVAVGPTTSTRMNPFQAEVLDMGVKMVVGKGGMDKNTANALIKNKATYLAAVGGCAALYVHSIKKINNVYWLDLGVPEAIWELEVENFGPLVVAMDSKGDNLYEEIAGGISNSSGDSTKHIKNKS
ncbi:FumA C-terminus/TtdB family hydratase beta subunit [Methanobacterium alcaliphilum]|uniref:FumA C-terminus/TtdB family hydratase beta subunit n=1 Tax=Methanobacterium alcaliphilum TaxID=392018 RepID=UPI00200AF294|nr:FumA C-terminus/TtdB family hydratase beta subunit [Methanobacterium alcaliphilum]MCK9151300.1 FumA C-terminus/TtdB family hydratase beta subunit [Methanobacterium alcaliphilum]